MPPGPAEAGPYTGLHRAEGGVEGDDAGGEEVEADVGEAGAGEQVGESLGRGEIEDGAGEVGVGGGVAGDDAADAREDAREVETICGAKKRSARLGELEDGKAAARLEDAKEFGKAAVVVGEVAEAEGGGEEVEGGVGEGKREGVGFKVDGADRWSGAAGKRSGLKGALRIGLAAASPERKAEARARGAGLFPALLLRPADGTNEQVGGGAERFVAGDCEHGMGEVSAEDASAAADGAFASFFVGDALESEREVASAAAEVENAGVGAGKNAAETAGDPASPNDVEAERKKMIEKIVAGGDRGEHLADGAGSGGVAL